MQGLHDGRIAGAFAGRVLVWIRAAEGVEDENVIGEFATRELKLLVHFADPLPWPLPLPGRGIKFAVER